jgi:divalent metal cation (Fe/Co/Zn/Cd) transporter
MQKDRFARAEFATWLGIICNLLLAVVKGIVGFLSGSKALIADAANSAADVAGSVAALIGIKVAQKPPDKDHPYGHGKAESIAAIVVSVLMLIVAVEVALSAVRSLYGGVTEAPASYALIVIVLTIFVKEALYQYKIRLGQEISSQAVVAVAWDHRTDVFASLATLVGVGGAILGVMFQQPWMLYLDPIAGLVVSGFIFRMGYLLASHSIHSTMDHVLHEEDVADLMRETERVSGVIAVDQLRAREHGHYVIIDLKISVSPRISVHEGHEIGKAVKQTLMSKFSHVSDVFVHINPYDGRYPYKNNVDSDHDDFPNILH